jgi:mono/diheme cytochrome c family protein
VKPIPRLGAAVFAMLATIGAAAAAVHKLQLPPETAVLTASALPGYQIAVQKCAICHSADYVNLQPPQMSLKQWTAEMVKMQHAYGAPLDDAEIKPLAVYLTATYGDVATVDAADLKPVAE